MNYFYIIFIFLISYPNFAIKYNVNLVWINREFNANQQYFCSISKNEKDYQDNCIKPIVDWLKKSDKDAFVRVWYDSKLGKDTLAKQARADIEAKLKEDKIKIKNLLFMDLRDLQDVNDNQEIFSEKTPVYFRADLLRAIVGDFLARKYPHEFIVYSDLNIPALSQEQLFDPQTLANLKKMGFVLAKNAAFDFENPFENAFFILNPRNKSLMQAHRKVLVDLNIKRGKEFAQKGYTKKSEVDKVGGKALCRSLFDQVVFISYKQMLEYYLYLEMVAEIIIDSDLKENLEKLFAKPVVEAGDKDSYDALIQAKAHSLWHKKYYPYSLLFRVPKNEIGNRDLFNGGYAEVGYISLFGVSGNKIQRLLYLRKIQPNDFKEAEKAVEIEKNRRKALNFENLFSLHKTNLNQPGYKWTFSRFFHGNTQTPIVHLEKGIYNSPSLMPVKEVYKPISSFYSIRSRLSDEDC